MIRQAGEQVGEPGLRVDVIELASGDQGVNGSAATAALVGAAECPVPPPYRDRPQLSFGRVIGHAILPSSKKRVYASQRLRM
jgi:hypothetical protein